MKKLLLLSFIFQSAVSFAQPAQQQAEETGVIYCTDFHITRPLREIAAENPFDENKVSVKKKESTDRLHRVPQKFPMTVENNGPAYGNDPALLQTDMGMREGYRAPIQNWAGQYVNGMYPMDPSGAAGTDYYVQAINATTMRVYNKTNGATVMTTTMGNLWSPATPNSGDPIIMYDQYANRWFISQFGTSGNKIYIAISTTSDPTGSYYTYTFTSPQFPDYLKFSVWQDGYYMTSNQSTQKLFVFERSAMLTGSATARSHYKTFSPPQGGGFFCPLPGDADGGLPPAGTPCPIFTYSDNGWGGSNTDAIHIYNFAVNWTPTTPTSTITLAATLPTAAFDGSYNASWNDISQPGTTQKLDGIGGVFTYRAQYRVWSTYNSVVLNWGVRISSTQRSIMWAELRQTGGVWSIYQQGVYTPDTYSRWLGSIAMDANGSIALCYVKSGSSTIYPSMCYTGRLATDPAGQMTFAEITAIAGTGYQSGTNRYGDYSQTALDPDGITFWHTGMYNGGSSGGYAGRTRIYSFQLPVANPSAGVSIASNDADNILCTGQSVTFTATPTNGGTAPSYQWQVNGVNAGTNSSTFTTGTLTTGSVVTVIMTSNLGGVTNNPATSNAITITVNSTPATPTGTSNSPLCSGNTLTLTTPTVSGATYAWTGPSGYSSTSQNPTRPNATTSMSGTYSVTVTVGGCTSSAGTTSVVVNQTPTTPAASSNTPVCSGSALNLTAPTLAGATYSWTGPAGFTSSVQNPTVASTTSGNAGTYSVTVSLNGCTSAAGNTTVVVNNPSAPVVSIALSSGTNPACTGQTLTFTATPTNGGSAPTYQWKVNGVNAGTNSSTFSTSSLANGDVVSVVLTSSSNCVTTTTATSNSITMTVNNTPSAATISQNGAVLTSSSSTGNQWYLNGTLIPGATAQTYTMTSNGTYTVVVTGDGCSSPASSPLVMNSIGIDELNPNMLAVYPNPNDGFFMISFHADNKGEYTIKLYNDIGQVVYSETLENFSGSFNKQVDIRQYAKGIYTLSLTDADKNETVKKVLIQ
jgi:hypothetical protein